MGQCKQLVLALQCHTRAVKHVHATERIAGLTQVAASAQQIGPALIREGGGVQMWMLGYIQPPVPGLRSPDSAAAANWSRAC